MRTLGFGQVLALAFSADGRLLAAAGRGGSSVQLVETEGWKVVRTLEGHARAVTGVAFSPDGARIVSGAEDGTVRLWEVARGRAGWVADVGETVWSVAFSAGGDLVASAGAGRTDQVRLWDAGTGRVVRRIGGHLWSVSSVGLSPDGSLLASGSWDQTVRLWTVPAGEPVASLVGHVDHVLGVAFSPSGDFLASCSVDKTVRLWDVRSGKALRTLRGHSSPVLSVAFSPDGGVLASGSTDHTVRLWSVPEGSPVGTLVGHGGWVNAVAFSADGTVLATGSEDGTVRVWDWRAGEVLRSVLPRANWVDGVSFSPDGDLLTAHSREGRAFCWEVRTGALIGVADDPDPCRGDSDGRWTAAGRADGSVVLAAPAGPARRLVGHGDRGECLAFSPDGSLLASGSWDGRIRLWDVRRRVSLAVAEGHTDWVSALAFSPDGQLLASGSRDGTAKLWHVPCLLCPGTG